jgi:Polyketide cyclase / dehydrase and lipid transport
MPVMRAVRAKRVLAGTVAEAEGRWYDTERWDRWIDGLEQVAAVQGPWPRPGATVTWVSGPAGRGRVTERVTAQEPLGGQTVEVDDESIRGRQTVAFTPVDDGVEVALTLEYEIKRRNPLTPLVDLLFIRRAFATSLQSTVSRFGAELQARRKAS